MGTRWGLLGAMGVFLLSSVTWGAEPVAVITEIRTSQGQVQVKRAGEAEWKAPLPLLSLRPGDQVRAAGGGQAVLVFTGGRGTQVDSQAISPFTVQAPAMESGGEKLQAVLASVTQFLLGQHKERTYQSLSTRSFRRSSLILTPRETRLLPGSVTFEWAGSDQIRYAVRVLGPHGVVWEQTGLPRSPFAYPASAPALQSGVSYTWELEARGEPVQRAQFELVSADEAERLRTALNLLGAPSLPGYPGSTVVLMRAGFLFQERLYHEARRELLGGIAIDPDEPTLHLLLGQVYERVGLKDQAAVEFDEAEFLSARKP